MSTVREFLEVNFGKETVAHIGLINIHGDTQMQYANFCLTAHGLSGYCGGECIIAFYPVPSAAPHPWWHCAAHRCNPLYLDRDDSAGTRWATKKHDLELKIAAGGVMTDQDWNDYHSGRPVARLRLVQSA